MKSPKAPLKPGTRKTNAKASNGRVQRLDREVLGLKRSYKELRDQRSIVVPITTFAPEPFELRGEILVVVQPDDDSFVASLFDANINASGNTEVDAVANLKDMMIALFEVLPKEKKLGKGPARQLAVLRELMRRKE